VNGHEPPERRFRLKCVRRLDTSDMNAERYSLVAVAGALLLAATAALTPLALPGVAPGWTLLDATLWTTTVLFGGTALVWVVLTYVVGAGYEPPEVEYGPDEVHVRVLTIDAEDVVQATVDSLPDRFDDVHVVAEAPIDVAGATVHVVPDGFDCEAVRKGRAIEWARRNVEHDREFVAYLDEDSLVEEFEGLPDADVVQLREKPRRSGGILPYMADIYRMGVQIEQRAFARLDIPLFAWGGGIAVRADLEDQVTWNRETIVEDTAFVWAAFREADPTFALGQATCRNEAPPSLYEIMQQRRRWAAGNLQAASMLPARYEALTRVRNYAWALSPVVTLVAVPLALLGVSVAYGSLFLLVSLGLAGATAFWFVRGAVYYGGSSLTWALAVPLAPLVTVVHSMGTIAGVLAPPEGFRVTEKVGPER
jgi:hypothetical protein